MEIKTLNKINMYKINKKVKRFKNELLSTFEFQEFELFILDSILEALKQYHIAMETLKLEGITIASKSNNSKGLTRQNPCNNIAKNNWDMFLKGIKLLKLDDILEDKPAKKIGRPLGKPKKDY